MAPALVFYLACAGAGCADDITDAQPATTAGAPAPGHTAFLPPAQPPASDAEEAEGTGGGPGVPGLPPAPPPPVNPPPSDTPSPPAPGVPNVPTPSVDVDAAVPMPDAGSEDMGEEPEEPAEEPVEPPSEPTPLCTASGAAQTVNATIVVPAGSTFDGECRRFVAGPAVGDGSQSEGQKPVFRLEPGARLRNVVLGAPAADGIHTYGDAELDNITWEDIGEDALTIKASGHVVLTRGAAYHGADKVFQINAPSTFEVSDFRADDAGKFIRQNGGTTFHVDVVITRCDISNMDEAIFRTDSRTSTVTMTDSRYSRIGRGGAALWYGVAPGNITERNNVAY